MGLFEGMVYSVGIMPHALLVFDSCNISLHYRNN